jgi:hypothetical protein
MRDPEVVFAEVGVEGATLPEVDEPARDPDDYSGVQAEERSGASEVEQPEVLPEAENADLDVDDPGVLDVALDAGDVIEQDPAADEVTSVSESEPEPELSVSRSGRVRKKFEYNELREEGVRRISLWLVTESSRASIFAKQRIGVLVVSCMLIISA